jgi:hypothetical protein
MQNINSIIFLTLVLSKSLWGLTIGHGPDPKRWQFMNWVDHKINIVKEVVI